MHVPEHWLCLVSNGLQLLRESVCKCVRVQIPRTLMSTHFSLPVLMSFATSLCAVRIRVESFATTVKNVAANAGSNIFIAVTIKSLSRKCSFTVAVTVQTGTRAPLVPCQAPGPLPQGAVRSWLRDGYGSLRSPPGSSQGLWSSKQDTFNPSCPRLANDHWW